MFQSFFENKRLISLGFVFVLVSLTLWWLIPRVLFLIYLNRGVSRLNNVLLKNNIQSPSICGLPITLIGSDLPKLEFARKSLEDAIHVMPDFSQSHLALGRTLCLLGEPKKSLKELEIYIMKNPTNPLGHIESAMAYYELMQNDCAGQDSSAICNLNDYRQRIIYEWAKANIDINNFRTQAELEFEKQQFLEASQQYMYYASTNNLTSSEKYRLIISNIISKQTIPLYVDPSIAPIQTIQNGFLHIDAEDLQWVKEAPNKKPYYGQSLKNYPGSDFTSSVIYWNGPVASVIYVPDGGKFNLSIRVQNSRPAPIKMDLEVNFLTVYNIKTIRDDMSWENFSVRVILEKGYHIVGVRFLNNYENNIDRDAVLKWIQLEQIK